MQIGIASDTSIEELNDYIKMHSEQFQYQPYHERYVIQNAKKVLKKRIDAFIFTKNTTVYELRKENLNEKIRNAGCANLASIYLAFSSVSQKRLRISKALKYFDMHMATLVKTNVISKFLLEYGIQVKNEMIQLSIFTPLIGELVRCITDNP